jgi:hypothetical protein
MEVGGRPGPYNVFVLPSVALSELDASVCPSFAAAAAAAVAFSSRTRAHLEKAAEAHPVADG